MEKRTEVEEELNQIDEELEKLFDRFADLISRRKRLLTESGSRKKGPTGTDKKSTPYVRHHKR